MVTIFICDDDEIICEKNKVEIRKICKQHEIVVAIATFYSGEALLRRLSTNPHDADVILLDILMKETNGAQVAKQLRNMKSSAEIIFLTSSEDYVFDVFETNPIQYLIKGNENSGKLEHALLKAIEISQKKRTEIFLVNSEGEKFQIPYRDIFYFEISLRIVDIHYDDKVLGF
ncbi:MAG: LytTR family DNA-binding domain-containing protein, partial [Lachnospiraceae bacterium]